MKTLKKISLAILIILCSTNFFAQGDPGGGDLIGGGNANSQACTPLATTWFLGGNNIIPPPPAPLGTAANAAQTDAGTCNEFPFILKANNFQSVFILPNTNVGIGHNNGNPSAALDIRGNLALPGFSHFKILADSKGNLESTTDITMNFATSKNFYLNEGSANTSVNHMTILGGGNVGFGTSSPALGTKLTIDAGLLDGVKIKVTGSSTAPVVALDVFDQFSNKINFRVKSNGFVYAREINVQLANFPDYVFDKEYELMSLSKLSAFIKLNHHLPNVPTAKEIKRNGANIGELVNIQFEKIEELTIYILELKEQIDILKGQIKNEK